MLLWGGGAPKISPPPAGSVSVFFTTQKTQTRRFYEKKVAQFSIPSHPTHQKNPLPGGANKPPPLFSKKSRPPQPRKSHLLSSPRGGGGCSFSQISFPPSPSARPGKSHPYQDRDGGGVITLWRIWIYFYRKQPWGGIIQA